MRTKYALTVLGKYEESIFEAFQEGGARIATDIAKNLTVSSATIVSKGWCYNMEKRRRIIKISNQKKYRPTIKFYKQEQVHEKCTFGASLPKNWVIENFKDELEKYDILQYLRKSPPHVNKEAELEKAEEEWKRAKEMFCINVDRQGNVLIVSCDKKGVHSPSSISSQEIEDLRNSLKSTTELERKVKLVYNWLIAKFVAGYDNIPLSKLDEKRAFLKKVIDPFGDTCFVVPLGAYLTDGLDFKNAPGLNKWILEIYEIVMDKLKEIDTIVRGCLTEYSKSHDVEALRKEYLNLVDNYDRQIEIIMWAVIRKICRYIDFREVREELSHTIFYIVLAADAKLLERYKDNYLDIIKALLDFSLPEAYCYDIARLVEKTFNLLQRAVDILLASAYLKEEPEYSEIYKEIREAIIEETRRIIEDCYTLDLNINEIKEKVKTKLIQQDTYTIEKGYQIWGYSRVFDRLHRHNKRVMNIAQSAMFGLPSIE